MGKIHRSNKLSDEGNIRSDPGDTKERSRIAVCEIELRSKEDCNGNCEDLALERSTSSPQPLNVPLPSTARASNLF